METRKGLFQGFSFPSLHAPTTAMNMGNPPVHNPSARGFRELYLTEDQAAALADWLADTQRVVIVGSVHAAQLMPCAAPRRRRLSPGSNERIPNLKPKCPR